MSTATLAAPSETIRAPSPRPSRPWRALALASVALLAAGLCVLGLASKSLWFDEAISVAITRMGSGDFVHTLWQNEANMSLYYVLLRGWVALGGTGEAWIRILSVGFALATIFALYALGRRLFGFRTALFAILILSTNAFFVQFAQEARGYMLAAFLCTLASLAFARGVEGGGARWWWLYTIAGALSVYAHFFCVFFPLAHAASLVFLRDRRRLARPLAASLGAMGLLILPAVRVALVRRNTQVWWNPPLTRSRLQGVFASMTGGGGAALAVLGAVLGLLAIYGAWRIFSVEGRGIASWRQGFAISTFVVPTVAILTVSGLERIVQFRYFSIVLPGLALTMSLGLVQLRQRWLIAAALVGVLGLSAVGLDRWYRADKEDWRGALGTVGQTSRLGDSVVLFDPYRVELVDYYASAARPAGLVAPSARFDPFPLYRTAGRLAPSELERLAARHDRIWLLTSDSDPQDFVRAARAELERTHGAVCERQLFAVRVELFERGAARATGTCPSGGHSTG